MHADQACVEQQACQLPQVLHTSRLRQLTTSPWSRTGLTWPVKRQSTVSGTFPAVLLPVFACGGVEVSARPTMQRCGRVDFSMADLNSSQVLQRGI